MHYDVTSCVICILNNVEYLEKEGSYKNSTKGVTLSPKGLHCHFKRSLQCNKKSSTKFLLHTHFKRVRTDIFTYSDVISYRGALWFFQSN